MIGVKELMRENGFCLGFLLSTALIVLSTVHLILLTVHRSQPHRLPEISIFVLFICVNAVVIGVGLSGLRLGDTPAFYYPLGICTAFPLVVEMIRQTKIRAGPLTSALLHRLFLRYDFLSPAVKLGLILWPFRSWELTSRGNGQVEIQTVVRMLMDGTSSATNIKYQGKLGKLADSFTLAQLICRVRDSYTQYTHLLPLQDRVNKLLAPFMEEILDFRKSLSQQVERIRDEKDKSYENVEHRTLFHELLRSKLPPNELRRNRLRDEAFSMVTAGSGTTAHVLRGTAYHIAANQTIRQRLYDELRVAIPDPSEPPPCIN
ncbi:hypothetical protein AJ78_08825 [Emergomyces pasteurianus Ep9510]|uniref:Cytochrome P450 n=1 Tax=Emergomyces pasteurianus Ep9510 TaxID=1447872 RepID=A0A1J9Q1Y7_9EURO|nr:hypothetical protein AJ78_08825 [Emergomyces pasteurianus Ep9510]